MYVNKIVSITILLFFLFCVFFKIRFSKKGEFFENYLSVETTRAIKGICAVLILLSHLCTYLADYFTSLFLFKFIGAMAVGGFFFVSGYGLQYGIMNKENYLKGFLKKRSTVLHNQHILHCNKQYAVSRHNKIIVRL